MIINLKAFEAEEVTLSYLTSRGYWRCTSWKGDDNQFGSVWFSLVQFGSVW